MNIVVKVALAYLETHPQVIEQLLDELVQNILSHLKASRLGK